MLGVRKMHSAVIDFLKNLDRIDKKNTYQPTYSDRYIQYLEQVALDKSEFNQRNAATARSVLTALSKRHK